jgi:O-antigen ligase
MKQLKSVLNYITLLSAMYLTASSIFYYPVQKPGFYIFFAAYIIEIFVDRKWERIHFDKKTWYFIVLAFFFMLAVIYLPFESSRKYTNFLFEKRFSLLGFALVGFFGVNDKFKLNYFLNTFIITSVFSICYLIFLKVGIHQFISNPLRADLFVDQRNIFVNSHMLFDFYLNISLIGIWYILTRSWNRTSMWKISLYIVVIPVFLGSLSISEGRSGFLLAMILLLGFVFFEIWKRKKIVGIVIALLIMFLFAGWASHHKRMSKDDLKTESRIFLWKAAVSIIKEKPILGHGISDAQEKFDVARAKFETVDYRNMWIKSPHLDSHDQYLQTTMEFGIIGILTLLFLYISPIFIASYNKRLFAFFIMFLCVYQSVFDMFITGPFASIFCLLVLLILRVKNNIVEPVKV